MKGTVYFKKWTKMPWWSRLYHLEQLSLQPYRSDIFNSVGSLINICDDNFKAYIKDKKKGKTMISDENSIFHSSKENRLFFIKKLFEQFPELRQLTLSHNISELKNTKIPIVNLINGAIGKYIRLINRGLCKENATRDILSEIGEILKANLDRTVRVNQATEERGVIGLKEYLLLKRRKEAEDTVKRLTRDSEIMDQNTIQLLEGLPEYTPGYTIVSPQHNNDPNQSEEISYEALESQENNKRSFIEEKKEIMSRYYDSVLIQDRLGVSSEKEILRKVVNTPSSLKKEFSPLLKICKKYSIRLSELGEIDWGAQRNNKVVEKFKSKSGLIKFALMLNDMNFGLKHLNAKRERGRKLRENIQRSEANKEEDQKEEERDTYIKEHIIDTVKNRSEADELISFIYFDEFQSTNERRESDMRKSERGEEAFLEGRFDRMDFKGSLKETENERALRLQAIWLKERLKNTEINEKHSKEIIDKIIETVFRLRRLKILFDKESMKNTSTLIWGEHLDFDFGGEEVSFESLEDYLSISNRSIMSRNEFEVENMRIRPLIEKIKLYKDLQEPSPDIKNYINLTDKDSNRSTILEAYNKHIEKTYKKNNDNISANSQDMKVMEMTPDQLKNYKSTLSKDADVTKDPIIKYLEHRKAQSIRRSKSPSKKK